MLFDSYFKSYKEYLSTLVGKTVILKLYNTTEKGVLEGIVGNKLLVRVSDTYLASPSIYQMVYGENSIYLASEEITLVKISLSTITYGILEFYLVSRGGRDYIYSSREVKFIEDKNNKICVKIKDNSFTVSTLTEVKINMTSKVSLSRDRIIKLTKEALKNRVNEIEVSSKHLLPYLSEEHEDVDDWFIDFEEGDDVGIIIPNYEPIVKGMSKYRQVLSLSGWVDSITPDGMVMRLPDNTTYFCKKVDILKGKVKAFNNLKNPIIAQRIDKGDVLKHSTRIDGRKFYADHPNVFQIKTDALPEKFYLANRQEPEIVGGKIRLKSVVNNTAWADIIQ